MIELFDLKQEDLHRYWPFLLRGVADIRRDLKTNWLPEDIYSALRQAQVSCVLARRADRLLGFLVYSKQQRIFSYEPELFVWAAWNLPLREQLPEDEMPTTVARVWQYIVSVAKNQYGTDEITWLTRPGRAKAFARKFGWRPVWVTMAAKV